MLTDRFDDAFRYAHWLHQSQTRKGTSIPYISHLMTVSALVVEHGGNEDQAIAALLHDAAEDQGGTKTLDKIRTTFGDSVATIVADCTDAWTEPKPPWKARKEAYLAALPHKAPASLLVSLADKTHNAEAIRFDYRVLGNDLWGRFNGGAEGTRWYYGALGNVFASVSCRAGYRIDCRAPLQRLLLEIRFDEAATTTSLDTWSRTSAVVRTDRYEWLGRKSAGSASGQLARGS